MIELPKRWCAYFSSQKLPILSILTLFLAISHTADGQAADTRDSDIQFWNETIISIPLAYTKDVTERKIPKISLQLLGTFRLSRNIKAPADLRAGAGIDLRLNRYFSVSPAYIYRRAEARKNHPECEHQIRFDLIVSKKWQNFGLNNRSRFEYRIRNGQKDGLRYRNRTAFSVPVKWRNKEIFTVFVADDPFYDITAGVWTFNEMSAGITRKLNSNTTSDIYYMHVNSNGAIKTVEAIGVNLKFQLN